MKNAVAIFAELAEQGNPERCRGRLSHGGRETRGSRAAYKLLDLLRDRDLGSARLIEAPGAGQSCGGGARRSAKRELRREPYRSVDFVQKAHRIGKFASTVHHPFPGNKTCFFVELKALLALRYHVRIVDSELWTEQKQR